LGATACTTPSTHSSPAQPVGLLGVDWILDDASLATQVAKVPAGIHIDLRFEGEQVSGSSGCNTYGGTFEAIGGSISFGPLRSTQMACDHRVMEAEAAYLRALDGSTAYEATSTTLHLTGGPVDLMFTAASPSASGTASPSQ
jgi:heat shock protein HslJ